MLITCYYYGCLLSNISTYHLKVASSYRPVDWNTVHKRRRDHVDNVDYYYGCLLSNISTYHLKVASRAMDWEQWNGILD